MVVTTDFWRGFEKRAENLALMSDSEATEPTKVPPEMDRSISKAGPRLADLTEESDRGKFTAFTGVGP